MKVVPPPINRARRAAARLERELDRQKERDATRRRFYDAEAICDLYLGVRVTRRARR